MRRISLLCGLVAIGAFRVDAAEVTNSPPAHFEAQTPKPDPQEKKTVVTSPKPTNQVFGTRVYYGGYLTDLARAEKKRGLFSLRTPVDPQKDSENLAVYPGPDKVPGFILFSIKF